MSKLDKFISEYISYSEATWSQTAYSEGIVNSPNRNQLRNMRILGLLVFDPLRRYFGRPITVTSMFRSLRLNNEINGSKTSQHCNGEAVDIKCGIALREQGFTNADLFAYIREYLEFDQLIWEFGNDDEPQWIHVSYNNMDNGLHNRMEVLQATRGINGAPTEYRTMDNPDNDKTQYNVK